MIFVRENGRTIPKEDKIFSISNRAKEMIAREGKDKVINGTIGALMDDDGKLIVLDSVAEVFGGLEPQDYAPYAPIGGIPEYKEAVKKAAFGNYEPKGFTEVVATPGGTGGIRNAVSNFSAPGDRVLVADWFWSPYKTICQEIGREIQTFRFFNEEGGFNIDSFRENVLELMDYQDSLVIIINSPAHNPTGYSISVPEWRAIRSIFEKTPQDKHVALYCDVAYIDFAGDEEQYRQFLPVLDEMPENVLPIIGYSASKTFTMYGMRCGAMICMAKTPAIAQEFRQACEFSSRGSWSNCNRAPQAVIARIYSDPQLRKRVDDERAEYREMLLKRGRAFEKAASECGLEMLPFDAGFFASIPMADPDRISEELEKEGIFLVPLAKGLRVSIASVPEDKCRLLPERIKSCMDRIREEEAKSTSLKLQHDIEDNFMGVKTSEDLNRVIKEGNFKELVQISEAYQDKRIVEIAQKIAEQKKRVVLLAGPSSSGKTTTAKKLCTQLKVLGLNPLYMGTDDYFVEREDTPVDEDGKPNYEDLDAVDVELFNENIIGLLKGDTVDLPTFDFMTGHKEFGKRMTSITRDQLIVIEGIHALNDDLTPHIPMHQKFKIFVCPVTSIETGTESGVDPIDHRMLRRMVRDFQFRGHTAKDTIDNWPSVRKGENKNIFPYKDRADVSFNTSHIYEIPVLKKYAEPLLRSVKKDEPEYGVAEKMLNFLSEFDIFEDENVIPNDSILREFIGGSTYASEDPVTGKKNLMVGSWLLRELPGIIKEKRLERTRSLEKSALEAIEDGSLDEFDGMVK